MIRWQYFSEPMPLGYGLNKCFWVSSPFRPNKMRQRGLQWYISLSICQKLEQLGIFLYSGELGSHKTPQIRLWLTSFSGGQAFLRGTECCGVFKNGYFSIPLSRSMGILFSDFYCENLVELLEVKLTNVRGPCPWLGPPRILNSQVCPCWACSSLLVT